ncbi:hypothetical protein PtA15_10A645 [Puccinia triticina]|uniref:Uncharacterized protein n=1 Tax=Puccinia triticina TaxID=208348 RepID=A0ABY7CVF6_9BASI|nr:uncharacterized protein PtA15_10A645 [Puccinia triticina]WAQ89221.1 hypothetical protein PtA15_10A645 [Puccinia triticina]
MGVGASCTAAPPGVEQFCSVLGCTGCMRIRKKQDTMRPRASSIQQAIFNHHHQQSKPITRQPSTQLQQQQEQQQEQQEPEPENEADALDLLSILDPAVNAASTLTHIRNCLFIPPMINHLGTPTIQLDGDDQLTHSELDSHLISILNHPRPNSRRIQQIKRLLKGLKAFISTPIGIIFTIYGFLVVFWGAALVLILLGWLKITPQENYRIWVEICSQVLNGLFTIPGIGLFPSRIIDCWNIGVIVHYARVIWKRKGKRNLDDPNDLIPPEPPRSPRLLPPPPSSADPNYFHNGPRHAAAQEEKKSGAEEAQIGPETEAGPGDVIVVHDQEHAHQHEHEEEQEGLTDVWKDEQEIVLNQREMTRLRRAQEALCRSQTWYRPHSSATHYAFPVPIALIIVLLNLGNSLFQAALCAVMWGLRYSTRPAWTTATFMALSFSCGISSGILVWRTGARTSKRAKVADDVARMIDPSSTTKLEPLEPSAAEAAGADAAGVRGVARARPAVHHHLFQTQPTALPGSTAQPPRRPPVTGLHVRPASPPHSRHHPPSDSSSPSSSSSSSNRSHSLIREPNDSHIVAPYSF